MKIVDDRTPEQKKTHTLAVVGTDSFLSGWGEALHGVSYAAWAFDASIDAYKLERWVNNRDDMKRVRVVSLDTYRPRGRGHCHIYVVTKDHPSQQ